MVYMNCRLWYNTFQVAWNQESRVAEVEIYFLGGVGRVWIYTRGFSYGNLKKWCLKDESGFLFQMVNFQKAKCSGGCVSTWFWKIVFISWWRSDRKNSSSKYSVVGGFVVSYPTIMTEWKFPPAIKMSWFLYFFPRRKYSEVWYSWQLSHFWFLLLSPTHRIHVWYIHLHSVEFDGKCRWIYHTWIIWANHFNADHTAHLDGLASRNPSSARYPWVSVHHRRCPVHCVSRSRVMCRFVVDVYGMLVLFNNLFLVLKVIKFLTEHNQRIDLYYIYICYVVAHCLFNVFFVAEVQSWNTWTYVDSVASPFTKSVSRSLIMCPFRFWGVT